MSICYIFLHWEQVNPGINNFRAPGKLEIFEPIRAFKLFICMQSLMSYSCNNNFLKKLR